MVSDDDLNAIVAGWPSVRCDDLDGMERMEEEERQYVVDHVCGNVWKHIAEMEQTDEEIAQALWEEAVAKGEPWALEVTDDGGS